MNTPLSTNIPYLLWITGLAGSGKTTIATEVYKRFKEKSDNVVLLDGDVLRGIFGGGVGHDPEGRYQNALRISRLCKFLIEQEINVICSTMSLFSKIHEMNRLITPRYYEVYVDVPIDELTRRDKKRLYSRALKGEIEHVVGVDQPFDRPTNPHLVIDNSEQTGLEEKANMVIGLFSERSQ